ncbi:hypothetical protein K439DRAFT_1619436 [Ramaria rubella]|nr:hypothetical protein K439DRAFT_1619436 [Ramaria rubella]
MYIQIITSCFRLPRWLSQVVTYEGFSQLFLTATLAHETFCLIRNTAAKLARFVTPEDQIRQDHVRTGIQTPQSAKKAQITRAITLFTMVETQNTNEDVVDGLRMFYSDRSEDAQLWKKKFQLHMLARMATIAAVQRDRMAAGMFAGYMRPNEAGEEWLMALTEDQQQSWIVIEALFTIKWPPEQ